MQIDTSRSLETDTNSAQFSCFKNGVRTPDQVLDIGYDILENAYLEEEQLLDEDATFSVDNHLGWESIYYCEDKLAK